MSKNWIFPFPLRTLSLSWWQITYCKNTFLKEFRQITTKILAAACIFRCPILTYYKKLFGITFLNLSLDKTMFSKIISQNYALLYPHTLVKNITHNVWTALFPWNVWETLGIVKDLPRSQNLLISLPKKSAWPNFHPPLLSVIPSLPRRNFCVITKCKHYL